MSETAVSYLTTAHDPQMIAAFEDYWETRKPDERTHEITAEAVKMALLDVWVHAIQWDRRHLAELMLQARLPF